MMLIHKRAGWAGKWVTFVLWMMVYLKLTACVIVDGDKTKLSATKQQANERQAIDQLNVKTCGMSDPDMEEHEFVNMARRGQFPWMVSMQVSTPEGASESEQVRASKQTDKKQVERETGKRLRDVHFCAGALISDKWILTAAHCFATPNLKGFVEHGKLKVVAGSHKVSASAPENRNLTLTRVFYHSKFSPKIPVGYDIALVELQDRVEFRQTRPSKGDEPFINALCLPLKDKRYKVNETARIAGWGLSSDGDISSQPSKLLTTDILIGDTDKCIERYVKALKSERPRQQRKQVDDLVCAHYKATRDACQADSGGPLVEYASHKGVAIGIVSYGVGCATKGVPGVYTRVSAYIGWIREIVSKGKEAKVEFSLIEVKPSVGGGDKINSMQVIENSGNSTTTTTSTKPPRSTERSTRLSSTTSTQTPKASSTTSTTSSPTTTTTTTSTTRTSTSTTTKPTTNAPTSVQPKTSTSTSSPQSSFRFFDQSR